MQTQTQPGDGPISATATRESYEWTMSLDKLPTELRTQPIDCKLTHRELSDRELVARRLFSDLSRGKWRHYTGSIYEVTGFGTSARDGQLEVQYREVIATALPGTSTTFHLPLPEWFLTLAFSEPQHGNPNLVEPDAPFMVHRYVPVFKAERYETRGQIEERGR